MSSADLLLHPVRLRIIQAFLGGRELTTRDLRDALPEVAVATLYRQVGTLAAGGVLEILHEHPVRGTVERTYRLCEEAVSVDADALASMTEEEHRRAFMAFVAGLLADFDRYLERDDVDFHRDQVGYRQAAMHLSDPEAAELLAELREVFASRLAMEPGPGRTRRAFSTVLMRR